MAVRLEDIYLEVPKELVDKLREGLVSIKKGGGRGYITFYVDDNIASRTEVMIKNKF